MKCRLAVFTLLLPIFASSLWGQSKVPPFDLWNAKVLGEIRNRSTLETSVVDHVGYSDVFFTSNPSADWFEATPPYTEHKGEKIRIHGFIAAPPAGGPYPALLLGHGHHGKADRDLTLLVASFGYVALFIDGPEAGESTGGPQDEDQAWISVDNGPQYGYLFHYAYAGMRALTLLESLADAPGNRFRIDAQKLGVLGVSMGGIFTSYLNGIDSRVKAAIAIASAGNWQHTLRFPNSWLYHGIYANTRDLPYNGIDPPNSIEDIDTDPTAINFINYFDPIRYAPHQYAPVLTVIGTHDEYFPLPNANLMELAIASAGAQSNFEKRLWILPNAPHQFDISFGPALLNLVSGLQQWLNYSFGLRERPLGTPRVTLSKTAGGLRFEVTEPNPATGRFAAALGQLYVATRVDSSAAAIRDFNSYVAIFQNDRFAVVLPDGEKSGSGDVITAENAIYYATLTDLSGLSVSSLVYKGPRQLDLSTDFVPTIEPFPGDKVVAPVPPGYVPPATTVVKSIPLAGNSSYQGMSLANTTEKPLTVRIEARTSEGRIAAQEGLINPVFIAVPPHQQRAFLADEWLGPGARNLDGDLQLFWSNSPPATLAFTGDAGPSQLDSINLTPVSGASLWLTAAAEQDAGVNRSLRIISASDSPMTADIVMRDRFGNSLPASRTASIPARGTADITFPVGSGVSQVNSIEVRAPAAVAAHLQVGGAQSGRDPWSIAGLPESSGSSRFVQPHVEWNGIFGTRLLMLNTSSFAAQDVRLSLHTVSGELAAPSVVQVLNPNAVASLTVESLFGIPPNQPAGAGWLEAETPGGQVLINALAVDPRRGAAAASDLQSSGTNWSLPFFVQNAEYYTGLAFANNGDDDDDLADVTIAAYDPAGVLLGQSRFALGPQESRTALVSQWIRDLAPNATGYLVITATSPIVPLAYFGTTDGAALAAIPFTK